MFFCFLLTNLQIWNNFMVTESLSLPSPNNILYAKHADNECKFNFDCIIIRRLYEYLHCSREFDPIKFFFTTASR